MEKHIMGENGINPITGARITDENDKPITRKINPKNLSPEQNKCINLLCFFR